MIRTDLLETLKEFLKSIPDERFNLLFWRKGSVESGMYISDLDLHTDCGTSACAMGWAAALPEFRLAGLSFEGSSIVLRNKDGDFLYDDFYAVKEVFVFRDFDVGNCLFSNAYYTEDDDCEKNIVKPERVISRIEKLLALLEIPEGKTLSSRRLANWEAGAEQEFIRCCSMNPTTY
ncbi:hypothetical protein [Acinetobacter phage vB_AbaS_TCUP2199]|nr:hypothetical protein [Acinetobacter phage vB_AbaS_TCUP2199]